MKRFAAPLIICLLPVLFVLWFAHRIAPPVAVPTKATPVRTPTARLWEFKRLGPPARARQKRTKQMPLASSYDVAGSGDASYDGSGASGYIDLGATANGAAVFEKSITRFLWWDGAQWMLSETVGASADFYYNDTGSISDIPETGWLVGGMLTPPAPTVTAGTPTPTDPPAAPGKPTALYHLRIDATDHRLRVTVPAELSERATSYKLRVRDVLGANPIDSAETAASADATTGSIEAVNYRGYASWVAVNVIGETEGPPVGFCFIQNAGTNPFFLIQTSGELNAEPPVLPAPVLSEDGANWTFHTGLFWAAGYSVVGIVEDLDAIAGAYGNFTVHALQGGGTGDKAISHPATPGSKLAWMVPDNAKNSSIIGPWTTFPLTAAPITPPAPVITVLGPTTAEASALSFDGSWLTVDLQYWRSAYPASVTTLAVTEGVARSIGSLLQDQPYLCRYMAHNADGDTAGPTTPFAPGTNFHPEYPDAPGELRIVRLRNTDASFELPALPANADALQLLKDGALHTGGLSGGATVVVLGLLELTDYTFRARAVNAYGQTAGPECPITTESTASQFPDPPPPEDDTTAPLVAIVEPLDGATVAGTVRVRVQASDDVGIVAVRFYVDGVLLSTLTELNWPDNDAPATEYKFDWLAREVPNGAHTLRVEAQDASGNIGSDTVTVTLSNSLTTLTKQLVTVEIKHDTLANFDSAGQELGRLWLDLLPAEVAGDDALNFNWTASLHPGTITEDAPGPVDVSADAPLLNDLENRVTPGGGESFRVIVTQTPRKVVALYDTSALRAIRLAPYTEGGTAKVAVLTRAPNKLFSLSGTTLSLIADLSGLTDHNPADVAYLGGLFFVAMVPTGDALPYVRAIDPATGRTAFRIEFSDDPAYVVTSLSAAAGRLWIGADDGAGHGKAWVYDGRSPDPSETTLSGVSRIYANGSGVLAGTGDGKIYSVTASGGTLLEVTGEATITALLAFDGVQFAGTGAAGKLFSDRSGAWALEQDFAFDAVNALAAHSGLAHLAGGNQIWRYAGAWQQMETLEDVTTIYDLLSYNEALLIASDGDATLRTREVPAAWPSGGVVARTLMHVALRADYRVPVEVP